jgi:signal transduction histidine kinase
MLQVLRIIQEALNNSLKHARAKVIRIDAIWLDSDQNLFIVIADDGLGLADPPRRGRGLNNMQRRAREVGGDLMIGNLPEGTEVRLQLRYGAWRDNYPDLEARKP